MPPERIIQELKRLGIPHAKIGQAIGRERVAGLRLVSGQRAMKADEIEPLRKLIAEYGGAGAEGPDQVEIDTVNDETFRLPAELVRDLHVPAEHLLGVRVRGDAMAPKFADGDQVLIDTRERNPAQPGAFAVEMDGSVAIWNVSRTPTGYRVSPVNPIYRDFEVTPEQLAVLGRPCWVARKI